MNDATFKLRVPTSELDRWKERAKKEGMPLAKWVRMRCKDIEVSVTADSLSLADDVNITMKFVDKPKTCQHGFKKGYNCWQCGGLAVIK